MDVDQLCSFPSAVVRTGRPSFYDDQLDKALSDLGLCRKVAVVEKSYLMLPLVLERCQLVAVVPAQFGLHAVQRHAVTTSDCPLELAQLSIGLYWHERTHRDPMYKWIRARIVSCVPSILKTPDDRSKIVQTLPVRRVDLTRGARTKAQK